MDKATSAAVRFAGMCAVKAGEACDGTADEKATAAVARFYAVAPLHVITSQEIRDRFGRVVARHFGTNS